MYNDKCRHYNSYHSITDLNNSQSSKSKKHHEFSDYEEDEEDSSFSSSSRKNLKSGILCPEMETINGTLLYKYMINVSFEDQYEQEISFDENGDLPAWLNFF